MKETDTEVAPSSSEQSPIAESHPFAARENGERTDENDTRALSAWSDEFARNLLHALVRFRDGDFGSRLPSSLVGVEGKIADVFNDILSVSSRRSLETARVCRVVGKEGKLKERMRVPGAVGGWAD